MSRVTLVMRFLCLRWWDIGQGYFAFFLPRYQDKIPSLREAALETKWSCTQRSFWNQMSIPIKYYSSVSGGLREAKASIWVQGSICYRDFGSVKSTVLFLNYSHIMQLNICVRALERITIKKSRLFYSIEFSHGRR